MQQHWQMEIQTIKHIQMLYEALEQDFPVQRTGSIQVWKRIALVLPVPLPYQNLALFQIVKVEVVW